MRRGILANEVTVSRGWWAVNGGGIEFEIQFETKGFHHKAEGFPHKAEGQAYHEIHEIHEQSGGFTAELL
jgi:hypothetical protein